MADERMGQKGQFFIISVIIVAFTLVSIHFLLAGYNLADSSEPFTLQEDYLFWNIKKVVKDTYHGYDCPAAERNMEEVELDTENRLARQRIEFDMNFTDPCGGPRNLGKQQTDVSMNLTSLHYSIFDEFTLEP